MTARFRSPPAAFLAKATAGIALVLGPFHLAAQTTIVERLAEHAYPLSAEAGQLAGAGAQRLAAALSGGQFVALGEEHLTSSIPSFAVALFEQLHRNAGFDYLAVEEGPIIGRMISREGRRGGAKDVVELAQRYPNAFHMLTLEELEMHGRVAAVSSAGTDAIWGVNQEFGALHAYEDLAARARSSEAVSLLEQLVDSARSYEGERFQRDAHYLVDAVRPDEIERLRSVLRPSRGSEVDRALWQLELSRWIYEPYGQTPSPPSAVFHRSSEAREENMKHLFTERYREAVASGDAAPAVLVKSGHLHLYRGFSPNNEVLAFGNFLTELATFNGSQSYHMYLIVDEPWVRDGWLSPFVEAKLEEAQATWFDLDPIRAWASRQNAQSLDADLRRMIMSFESLVLFNDRAEGSLEGLRTPRFRWYPSN